MKTKKRIEINAFNNYKNFDKPTTESCYNFKPSAKLEASKGIIEPSFPYSATYDRQYTLELETGDFTKVEGITCFKQYFPEEGITTHRLLIYGNDKKVYINQLLNNSGQIFWLYRLEFENPPTVLTCRKNEDVDIVILADKQKMVFWETGKSPYEVADLPVVNSVVMCDNYIYCTLEQFSNKIWFTASRDLVNIGNIDGYSGYITLDAELGEARRVVEYNKEAYIIRDYGISKITQILGEITVSNVYASNSLIYANTVSSTPNGVYFMTREGLYSFNGYKVEKTKIDLDDLKMDCRNAVGSTFGDSYYLAVRLNFEDENKFLCETGEYVNNALIIMDVKDNSFEIIRGVDIKNFLPVKTEVFEKMLVVFNSGSDGIGEIADNSVFFSSSLPKLWRSGDLVTSSEAKLFTKLSVIADANVKVKLKYDNKETSFTTYATGMNEFAFKICSKQMKIEISSTEASANVKNVVLDYYVY